MAKTVLCARCRFEVEVARTARGDIDVKGDLTSLVLRCARRKDNIIRASDLDCQDLQTAILEASQSGRV